MGKRSIRDFGVDGKTVLLRVDYNLPMNPGTTDILDDSRIIATLPTLTYLLNKGGKVVIVTHLGRPNGQRVDALRLEPVSDRLSTILKMPVLQIAGWRGSQVKASVESMSAGSLAILENIRFDPGEETNDPELSRALASLADVYVNDAFGTAHRAHASTEGVAHHLPALAGLLMERELSVLGDALNKPIRPFTAIVGGAKVSDKIAVLNRLASLVDTIIIGGGMAATFLFAQGHPVGASPVDEDRLDYCRELTSGSNSELAHVMTPTDVVIAPEHSETAMSHTVPIEKIPTGFLVLDIGPATASAYAKVISASKTVLWNGPMGVFEWEPFSNGTKKVAEAVANLESAVTVIGGGSTANAVSKFGFTSRVSHISTGGGATLEFIEGNKLPGVAALMEE